MFEANQKLLVPKNQGRTYNTTLHDGIPLCRRRTLEASNLPHRKRRKGLAWKVQGGVDLLHVEVEVEVD